MFEIIEDITVNTLEKGEVKLSQLDQAELQLLYEQAHFKQYLKKATVKKTAEATEK